MTTITVEVADLSDLATRTDITEELKDADCSVPLNEEGTGGISGVFGSTLSVDPMGKAVLFSFDSTVAASVVIEGLQVDGVDAPRQTVKYNGRGLGSLLDRYRCAPTLGAERVPSANERTFTFASPEFTATGWGTATEYGSLLDDTEFWNGKPAAFPAFDVQRIGPSEGTDEAAPQGYWYTLKDFTLAEASLVRFFTAADNAADVYIDGFQLGRITSDGGDTKSFDNAVGYSVFLSAGTHRVGARVVNVPFGGGDPGYGEGAELGGNPTFFILVGYTAQANGRLLDRVVETDSTWDLLSYPDDPPGLTDAEVVEILVAEQVAADVDVEFSVTVHGTHTPRESITIDVGQSLLEHLRDRADATFLDWRVPPDALEVHVYPPGDLGSVSGIEFSVDEGNIVALQVRQLDIDTTGLWVSYGEGNWTFVGTHGRDGSLRTRCKTVGEAKRLAESILARDPQPEQVSVEVEPDTGQIPGVDLLPGDTVTAGTYLERLIGWSMRATPYNAGEPRFGLELKDRIRGDAERLALMVQRAAPGGMGGSAPSSPAQDPPEFAARIDQRELEWTVDKDPAESYATGEAPKDKIPSASGNLYAVRITAKALTSGTASVAYLVDGVDALAGAGDLPSSDTDLTVVVPTDEIYWLTAGVTRTTLEITAVGTGLEGLVVEGLVI